MKRIYLLAVILTALAVLNIHTLAASDLSIQIDSEMLVFTDDTGYPFVDENDRTLVPFRHVLEAYGANVSWNGEARVAIADLDGCHIEVPIGRSYIYNSGYKVDIDTKAQIINGRTYLPLRAVVEAFGASVTWHSSTKMIAIDRPDTTASGNTSLAAASSPASTSADIALGSSTETLIQIFGQPTATVASGYDFDWWLYADDYKSYMQIGVKNGKIRGIQSAAGLSTIRYDVIGLSKDEISNRYGSPLRGVNHDGVLYIEGCDHQDVHKIDGGYLWVNYDAINTDAVSSFFVVDTESEEDLFSDRKASTELESSLALQLFHWTNALRVKEGMPAFTYHDGAADMASAHGNDMADNNYFSHTSLNGDTLGGRLDRYSFDYRSAGENIACNQCNAMMAIEALMHSDGHRKNILSNDFDALGTGVGIGSPFIPYYVQNFIGY